MPLDLSGSEFEPGAEDDLMAVFSISLEGEMSAVSEMLRPRWLLCADWQARSRVGGVPESMCGIRDIRIRSLAWPFE